MSVALLVIGLSLFIGTVATAVAIYLGLILPPFL